MFCDKGGPIFGDSTKYLSRTIKEYPVLTRKEEKELFVRIENGDVDARRIVILSNTRLVVSVAATYWRKCINGRVKPCFTIDDLIQQGFDGVNRAIDTFDWRRGCKFSTYCISWIRQRVVVWVANVGNVIRLPRATQKQISDYKKILSAFRDENRRNPTLIEISKRMGVRVSRVKEIQAIIGRKLLSINAPISPMSKETMESQLESREISPKKAFDQKEISEIGPGLMKVILSMLSEKERLMLELRLGLNGQDPLTFVEIGKRYGLTRERVRQITDRAIIKLRKSACVKDFRNLISNNDSD
jgi:RNA polymerase primary sigma factor